MRGTWLGVVLVLFAIEGAAAARGAGFLIPPVEVDVGATTPVEGGAAVGPSTDVLVGLHWATIAWRPTTFDIGVGYVGSFRPLEPGVRTIERSTTPAREPVFTLHGGYLSLGKTFVNQRHFRTWIEARGELMRGDVGGRSFSAIGGALRVAAELYGSTAKAAGGGGSVGIVAGTIAIGVYIEASHRDIATELGPTGVTTGVSFRIPFVLFGVS